MAKDGAISRPEFTDAAMAERAECVMLNKGPYIERALQTLDDIIIRMETHQHKKQSFMRALQW
jgi:pyruvate kinase